MIRPPSPRYGVLACLLACLLSGCAAETPDPLVEAGRDLLRSARPPSDEAFDVLNRFVIEQPAVAAEAAAGLVDGTAEEVRYAAIYVLGLTAEGTAGAEGLARALDDPEVHLRAIAASSLIGLGDKRAIPVLIELLLETDEIPGSLPPMFVDRFSTEALTFYTGEDFGITNADSSNLRQQAQERWREWWETNQDRLRWDPTTQRYVL